MTENDKTQSAAQDLEGHHLPPFDIPHLLEVLGGRSIVLVGIMGCGKSTVGKRLAHRLGLEFVDADTEIERAANMSVSEIFATHGEPYFRSGEERVIARLLGEGPQVLATGGGAFISPATRNEINAHGLSIWLKVDFDTVMARVRRRSTRPLLQNPDPEGTMRKLMAEREPVYAQAALTVMSKDVPHEKVVDQILMALTDHLLSPADTNTPQMTLK
ncbi:shikimate kinase [Roseibium denhamense]|uniref:Shikimate kinase n=1 Tax=Roseibium denhamense TaxID=76305 RepID=A0ABY1P852_9HYPH|nr:shikimate kinase [Roseibium denhamense]MTI07319.1 shikimate kinase [Roseibium denhamense]SMP28773.1 shikimate kinase [Roseibium denhamense]